MRQQTNFREQFRRGNARLILIAALYVGGAKPDQALVWNVRTCRPPAKGDVQAARTARTRVAAGHRAEQLVVGWKVL
jgi:hypothetical protein